MNSEHLNHHNSSAFLFIVHFRPFLSCPFPGSFHNSCDVLGTIIFKDIAVLLLNYTESVLTNWRCFLHLWWHFLFWTMIRMKRDHFGFSASFISCTNTFAQYLTKLELWRIRVQTQNNNRDGFLVHSRTNLSHRLPFKFKLIWVYSIIQ